MPFTEKVSVSARLESRSWTCVNPNNEIELRTLREIKKRRVNRVGGEQDEEMGVEMNNGCALIYLGNMYICRSSDVV